MAKKISKEVRAAMEVQALLQGVSVEDLIAQASIDNEPEDIDIEIVDDKKGKTKKTKTAKKSSKEETIGSEKQIFTTTQTYIPDDERFKKLDLNLKMNVTYAKHDIPYKEQFWPVPERTVEYQLELIRIPKKAKDVSDLMNKNSAEERKKAEQGLVRYFMLVNHDENVSHKIREIAYVKVSENKGSFSKTMIVNSRSLKDSNGNPERVKKNLERLLKNLVKE